MRNGITMISVDHNMYGVIIPALACFILLGAVFCLIFKRLISQNPYMSASDVLQEPFSPSHYTTMRRLLDFSDESFLRTAGWSQASIRKFRKSRITIFRAYLNQLSYDFRRISNALKLLMVCSKVDRPDLWRLLAKQRLTFTFAMLSVKCRLVLFQFGWSQVDAHDLVQSLELIYSQLQ